LFADIPKENVAGRLSRLIEYHFELFIQNETEFRLFLGSVINDSVKNKNAPSRAGRRVALIEEALEGKRESVDKITFTRMVDSLSLIFGIESITVLKDLCLLDNDGVLGTWKWLTNKIVAGDGF
jgi:hypothetical protein